MRGHKESSLAPDGQALSQRSDAPWLGEARTPLPSRRRGGPPLRPPLRMLLRGSRRRRRAPQRAAPPARTSAGSSCQPAADQAGRGSGRCPSAFSQEVPAGSDDAQAEAGLVVWALGAAAPPRAEATCAPCHSDLVAGLITPIARAGVTASAKALGWQRPRLKLRHTLLLLPERWARRPSLGAAPWAEAPTLKRVEPIEGGRRLPGGSKTALRLSHRPKNVQVPPAAA